jgi:protein-tyrosine phosphatase
MHRIEPYPLWIGHWGEEQDLAAIFDAEIEAVVELAAEEPAFLSQRNLICCRFPLLDGVGNRPELLALAIRTLATLLEAGTPTLACCSGGVSRAPAVASAALALLNRESPEECLKRVALHHHCDVSPGLWRSITQLPHELYELGVIAR